MNIAFYGEKLFPEESQNKIKTYKYSGTDKSLLYKHFYGKIAQIIVDNWMPETIA